MKWDACLGHHERLTALRPKYPDVWYNHGLLLAEVGKPAEALLAVNRALEIHSQYIDAGVSRAFLLAEVGRAADGFREFKRLHVRSPDDFFTLFALGVFCMRNGWKDAGLAQLLRAESLRPNLPYVVLSVAAALHELGRSAPAQGKLFKARAIVEDLGIESLLPGVPVQLAGLEHYHRWVDPSRCKASVLFVNFTSVEGDLPAAEEELLQAQRQWPGQSQLLCLMAKMLAARERIDESKRWLTAAVRMDEESPQAHLELGFIHAEAKQNDLALEALQKAVALRPLYPDYHFHLGTLLLDMGQTDEAIQELKRVLTVHPSYGHAPIYLANAYLEKGAADLAISVLGSSAIANWPEALLLMAQAHARKGDRSRASDLLVKLLAADPENREARAMLETIREHALAPAQEL